MYFRYIIFTACITFLVASASVKADSVTVDLEYDTDTLTWELYALINDTGSGNSGDFGLASIRALIDNIDYGTAGDAVTFASGIGAISSPLLVIQTTGGTLDITYGQDTSDAPSVVGGVGSTRDLILSGTFASAGTPPAFGDDDSGNTTYGNFLDVAVPGPFGGSLPWDSVALNTIDVTAIPGDYNGDFNVDAADYTVWRDNLGSSVNLDADGDDSGTVDAPDYTIWVNNFGASSSPSLATSVPEPSSALSIILALSCVCSGWRGSKE